MTVSSGSNNRFERQHGGQNADTLGSDKSGSQEHASAPRKVGHADPC